MRALFTSVPAFGHLIPVLPLLDAAARAGDDVVLAVDEPYATVSTVGRFRALPPSTADLFAESNRRNGPGAGAYRTDDVPGGSQDGIVELFTSLRIDCSYDTLDRIVTEERPDVIVAEQFDYLAPVVASAHGLPWVPVVHSPAPPLDVAMTEAMTQAAAARGITVTDPLVTVRQWPTWLSSTPPADVPTLTARPVAHSRDTTAEAPAFGNDAPVVLVSLGTVVDDTALLRAAVEAGLAAGANVVVTTGPAPHDLGAAGRDPRVRAVTFVPLGELLGSVDAVVAAGGSGTTLAALSHGLPLVFVPRVANQPQVAELVAACGAGLVRSDGEGLAEAVSAVLREPGYRTAAAAVADRFAGLPDADRTWGELSTLVRSRAPASRHRAAVTDPSVQGSRTATQSID